MTSFPTILQKVILIVDDSLEDSQTYNRYLSRDNTFHYTIIDSETGEEGINLYERYHPDLILLDFNLPDMDGLEFIAELKARNNRLSPIIILTGEGNEAIAVIAIH